ncbi:uncharacterized protein LOC128303820 [Anopheles moucheti]|uniref:uncharacterized protein LOC128303820 n=1 Tax=Anopheles moucheti TaxID=186751 RepID=UPI0022F11326|nr:uncharacterized protein LOC128303820 [Anopheles moucheti]
MGKLNKIIVTKYFRSGKNMKPQGLLTDKEYKIVKNVKLSDLLSTVSSPVALNQICEGEKLQTAEFYKQKEKRYKRDVLKLNRKPMKGSGRPRTVRQVVPSQNNQTVIVDIPPSDQLIATEDAMGPTRSNESHGPLNDPYQLPEEIGPIPIVMLPEDENFGSNDVDGARDFLQLCTGEEMPPMSIRETMTRDMLLAQLPSIRLRPSPADNFQELDLALFKRPLGTQESTVAVPLNTAVKSIPATVATVPTEVQPGPSGENSEPSCSRVSATAAAVESTSSSELLETPAPRRRRIKQESSFTERLKPFDMTVPMPKARQNFDIFSVPCPANWNKAIKDVQKQLSDRYKQHKLRELTDMPAPAAQKINSGFQQTQDGLTSRLPTMSVTETSNLVTINQLGDEQPNVRSIQQDTLIPPIELEVLGSIDGKLTEVLDNFHLTSVTDGTFTGQEKTATEQLAPAENIPSVLKESLKDKDPQPVAETDSRPEKKIKLRNCNKKSKQQKAHQNENDPMPDVSSVLFNQAQELGTIADNEETVEEMLPIDPMIVDILLTVQSAMNNEGQLGHPISIQRLLQLLQINSPMGAAKVFKNILLLKHADLLTVETNADLTIRSVSCKLPQVDVSDGIINN